MSASGTITNLQQALTCAGKCDCCNQLQQQINDINSRLAQLKPVDEERIVNRAIEGSKLLMPGIAGTVVALKIAPVLTEVGLLSKLVAEAAIIAKGAASAAASALSKIAGIATALAALAASVATLLVLGNRIDAVEQYVDGVANDVTRLYSLVNTVSNTAKRADAKASQALVDLLNTNIKVQQLNKEISATNVRVFEAKSLALQASSKAGDAQQSANKANAEITRIAPIAINAKTKADTLEVSLNITKSQIDQLNQQVETANNNIKAAFGLANEAKLTATNAISQVKTAINIANQAQIVAEQSKTIAGDAIAEANESKIIANNAIAEANKSRAIANDAISKANKALQDVNSLNQQLTETKQKIATLETELQQTRINAEAALQLGGTALQATTNLGQGLSNVSADLGRTDAKAEKALSASQRGAFPLDNVNQKIDDKFQRLVEDNNKALKIRDLQQSELSKRFDELNNEFFKSADDAFKIAQGNSRLAEERWQQTLKMQEDWARQSNKDRETINSIDGSIDQKLKTVSDKSLDTLRDEMNKRIKDFENYADRNARIAQGDTRLAEERWQETLKELETTFDGEIEQTNQNIERKLQDIQQQQREENRRLSDSLKERIRDLEQGGINTTTNTGEMTKIAQKELERIIPRINDLERVVPQVDDLGKRIRSQEKVNEQALPKLDDILGKIGGIPALTIAGIRPAIPTLPQIETATGTAMCRSMNGGCSGRRLDGIANTINNNTNTIGNALGAANAGANVAQLSVLNTINTKLGSQVVGGVTGLINRVANSALLERTLAVLTFATTLHNAAMLSNDIAQTLLGAINNIVGLVLPKDHEGQAIDVGQIINSSVENAIKGTIGENNYTALSEGWAKANRMYQAASNMLNAVTSMFDSVRSIVELTAGQTGKIGNALKNAGVVFENAYSAMSEKITGRTASQAKWDKVLEGLQSVETGVSAFSQVTSEIVSVADNLNELKEQRNEFLGIKAAGENTAAQSSQTEKKAAIVSKNIPDSDLLRAGS